MTETCVFARFPPNDTNPHVLRTYSFQDWIFTPHSSWEARINSACTVQEEALELFLILHKGAL